MPRDFEGAYTILIHHYFSGDESLYNETTFERRFRMPPPIINRLWEECEGTENFVQKTYQATKRLGIRPFVRFISAISQIKYGDCADSLDGHLQLSETVSNEASKGFYRMVVDQSRNEYLNWCPTPTEKERSINLMKRRGFPGCFGSWDYKHYL